MGKRKRHRSRNTREDALSSSDPADEPTPEGPDWIEYGGTRILAVDCTEGGAPYGVTEEEFREGNRRYGGSDGWNRAWVILRFLFSSLGGPGSLVRVGYVKRVGKGCSRDLFAAEVEVQPDPDRWGGFYVAGLPQPGAPIELEERTRWEGRVLSHLQQFALPFQVPRPVGLVPSMGRTVLVRSFLEGIPLDPRAGTQRRIRPWEFVGAIAATIHSIPIECLGREIPGRATRRSHAEAELSVLDVPEDPILAPAHAWARAHMPPEEPSRLIHGDLLGQNILVAMDGRPGVIDWENSRLGDPAYDLAIVTRGNRTPFQVEGGLRRLLESYEKADGCDVRVSDVRLYELCLAGGWYREAVRGHRGNGPCQEAAIRVRRILQWAEEGV